MLLFANQLYRSLQKELMRYQAVSSPTLKEIEQYFQLSFSYWASLYKKFAFHSFRQKQEEIHFFKSIKPLFTCEIEYTHLLYQANLFQPALQDEGHLSFWTKESERLVRFQKEHPSFYDYYKNKCTHKDQDYYTRNPAAKQGTLFKIYEDEHLSSLYDPLAARRLALERYSQYVERYLGFLSH